MTVESRSNVMQGNVMHMRTARLLVAAIAIVAAMKCSQSIFTAPPGSSIGLLANPTSIPANGGVAVITAVVIDGTGQPVPDGTVVQFFTNLGRIDPQGRTNDGIAKVNLVSDGRSGVADVSALSGGGSIPSGGSGGGPSPSPSGSATATPTTAPTGGGGANGASIKVTIGSKLPASNILAAEPRNIARTGPRFTTLTSTVFDGDGNPVANVPVVFTLDNDTDFTESLESGGRPIFTDNNGQARDRLFTSIPRDAPTSTVIVSSKVAGGSGTASNAVTVGINF